MKQDKSIEKDIKWETLVEFVNSRFGMKEYLGIQAVLFLIGLNELGKGYKELEKEEQLNLLHIAICRLLSNYGYYDITASSRGGYYLIDERSFLTKIDDEGTIIFSIQLYQVNQSIIELEDGDIVVGGYGFREGNDGGAISLIRLDPSQFE